MSTTGVVHGFYKKREAPTIMSSSSANWQFQKGQMAALGGNNG